MIITNTTNFRLKLKENLDIAEKEEVIITRNNNKNIVLLDLEKYKKLGEKMRVLGIDPGTAIVGYSIIDNSKKKYDVLDYGCIFTEKDEDMPIRLEKIYDSLDEIVKRYKPTDMAIEDLFFSKIRRRL